MLPEGNLTLDSILEGILDEEQTAAGTAPPQPPQPPQVAHPHPSQNPPPVTIKTEQTSSSSPTISSSGAAAGAVSAGSSSVSMQHHSLDDIPCISIKAELPDSCTAAVDDIMVSR